MAASRWVDGQKESRFQIGFNNSIVAWEFIACVVGGVV